VDAAAKQGFVAAIRAGTKRDTAAAAQGFSANAFYCARKRDPLFRQAWDMAMELSAIDQREARRAAEAGRAASRDPIEPNSRRRLQRRRTRGTRFTDRRKQLFLDHFAATADLAAAADVAGVHLSTIYRHLRLDQVFADGCDDALRQAYVLLEAEAVRLRLEAQRRAAFEPVPTGEVAQEFERVLKLLARYERKSGRIGFRSVGPGRERRWTFDEAIAALDKRLRALGARTGIAAEPIAILPRPKAGEE
jgi:hypothetical protein